MRFEKLTTSSGSSSRSSCWFVTNPASISISTTSPRSARRIFCKHRRSSRKHAPWQNYTDSHHTNVPVLQFYSHHTRQPLVYNQRILLVQYFTAHMVLLVASATTAFWLGRKHLRSTDSDTCIVSVPVLDVYIMCIKSVKRECSSKRTSTYYLSICVMRTALGATTTTLLHSPLKHAVITTSHHICERASATPPVFLPPPILEENILGKKAKVL